MLLPTPTLLQFSDDHFGVCLLNKVVAEVFILNLYS